MRFVIMDTGRGVHAGTLETWREKLRLEPTDEVAMIAWQPPREPLAVTAHYVLGPVYDPVRPARSVATAGDGPRPGLDDISSAESAEAAADDDPGSPLDDEDLVEQMPEQLVPAAQLRAGDSAAQDSDAGEVDAGEGSESGPGLAREAHPVAGLPRHHPDRLRHALRWRANKARLAARRGYRRARTGLRTGSGVPARAARKMLRLNAEGIATQFALAAAGSTQVQALVRGADIVVPVDQRSQRAAWVLARLCPGPEVIASIPAAVRVAQERREASGPN